MTTAAFIRSQAEVERAQATMYTLRQLGWPGERALPATRAEWARRGLSEGWLYRTNQSELVADGWSLEHIAGHTGVSTGRVLAILAYLPPDDLE